LPLASVTKMWRGLLALVDRSDTNAANQSKGRAARWRCGVRVIYCYHDQRIPLYLLTVFGKNEKSNITKSERNGLAKLVGLLVHVALEREHV